MKKFYLTLVIVAGIFNLSLAQIKTTGVVTLTPTDALKPITIKLDMNKAANLLTMTVSGPADRMFYIGFNGSTMSDGATDAVAITKLGACDQLAGSYSSSSGTVTVTQPYIPAGGNAVLDTKGFTGHSATTKDDVNDWTVISDDGDLSNPALATRTVVATRPLNTGNPTEDYTFDFDNLTNLNVIWAMGRDFVPNVAVPTNPDSPDNGYWALSGKNTVGISTRHSGAVNGTTITASTRGTSTLTFTTTESKTTGLVTLTPQDALKPITLKLDMDKTMGKLYMTVTGPADRMFYVGFNGSTMSNGATDAVAITKLGACDQLAGTYSSSTGTVTVTQPYIPAGANVVLDTKGFAGHSATTKDDVNDWTVISDDGDLSNPALTTRTVVASRPLDTGNSIEDYIFDYDNLTNLNVIWAMGRDFVPNAAVPTNPDSPDNGYWALSGKNTVGISTRHSGAVNGTTITASTRGTSTLTFTTQSLGIEDIAATEGMATTLENISIYPNPSTGVVNILNTDSFSISKVRVFDFSARMLQEINNDSNSENISINLSNCTKGMYFIEISNGKDKAVKKIILE